MKKKKHFKWLICSITTVAIAAAPGAWSVLAQDETPAKPAADEAAYTPKTKRELQRQLTPMQFEVTQNEGTEPAFKNRYWNNKKKGIYKCIVCDQTLFTSNTKYKSGTGWPSFYTPYKIRQRSVPQRQQVFLHSDRSTLLTMRSAPRDTFLMTVRSLLESATA